MPEDSDAELLANIAAAADAEAEEEKDSTPVGNAPLPPTPVLHTPAAKPREEVVPAVPNPKPPTPGEVKKVINDILAESEGNVLVKKQESVKSVPQVIAEQRAEKVLPLRPGDEGFKMPASKEDMVKAINDQTFLYCDIPINHPYFME